MTEIYLQQSLKFWCGEATKNSGGGRAEDSVRANGGNAFRRFAVQSAT